MSCDAFHEVPPPGTELFAYREQGTVTEGEVLELEFGDAVYKVRVTRVKAPSKWTPAGRQQIVMEVIT